MVHTLQIREDPENVNNRGTIKPRVIGSIIPSFCRSFYQLLSPVSGPLAQLKLHLAHPPTDNATARPHPPTPPTPVLGAHHAPSAKISSNYRLGDTERATASPFRPPLARAPATDCSFKTIRLHFLPSFPTGLPSLLAACPATAAQLGNQARASSKVPCKLDQPSQCAPWLPPEEP